MGSKLIILADIKKDCSNLMRFSMHFAEISKMDVVILYQHIPVIPSMLSTSERNKLIKSLAAAERRKIEKLIKSCAIGDTSVKISITRNDLPDEVSEKYSREDVIILSLNEKAGFLKNFLPVKTTIPVINNLNNTVICIPEGNQQINLFRCRVAVQKSIPLDVHELKRIISMICGETKELNFFSILNQGEAQNEISAYLKELTDYFHNDADVHASFDLMEGSDVFESIKDLKLEVTNEFLIIQKGSRLLTDKIFRKFLITEIINHAKIPLIVIG